MGKEPAAVRRPDDSDLALGGNDRCNNTVLRKASRRVSQLYDAVLAPSGLRQTQRSILMHIARLGSPSLGKLALSLVLDRSALGHNLRPLERDGFIIIEADPDDKRSRMARLTKEGARKLRDTAVLWEAAQQRFETKVGIENARALREALAVIAAENFDEVLESAPASTRRRTKFSTPADASSQLRVRRRL